MAKDGFNLADYVTVAERRTELRDADPESFGAYLRPLDLRNPYRIEALPNGDVYVVVVSGVFYRDHDGKERGPFGVGMAWEPYPGPTQFTRESELQNAETASWGRAIVANGAADTKRGIASADEVEARHGERRATDAQRRTLDREIETRGLPDGCPWPLPDDLSMRDASAWIDRVKAMPLPPAPVRVSTLRDDAPSGADDESGPPRESAAPGGPDSGRLPRAGDEVPPWRRRRFPDADAPASQVAAWWTVAYAAVPGVAHKKFLDAAQHFARELERPVPLSTGDVRDPNLVDVLFEWLDERVGVQPTLGV